MWLKTDVHTYLGLNELMPFKNLADVCCVKKYENDSLKRIPVDGGYIENGVCHFYIQDYFRRQGVIDHCTFHLLMSHAFAQGQ